MNICIRRICLATMPHSKLQDVSFRKSADEIDSVACVSQR